MSRLDRQVQKALQDGLQIVAEPYAALAGELGVGEDEVIAAIRRLGDARLVKRFGMIVRHRKLGFTANAMVVWGIPDDKVDAVGAGLGEEPRVTLSYRRRRREPDWNYNLFCMIHGRSRDTVLAEIDDIVARRGLVDYPRAVLFSTACYKQRGAVYV